MFEVAVGGEGLKNFGVDSPAAAAELMDEQRRDRAEFEIGGVEVGALLPHRRLALGSLTVFFADRDATLVFDTNRFDDPHQAIGNGPIDLRQVPVSNLPARFGVNARRRSLREMFGLAQQLGLVLFQGEAPDQTQTFHFFNEGRLQIQSVTHPNIQIATAQPSDQILEQSQRTGDLPFAVLLKAHTQGDRERGADQGDRDDAVIVLNIGLHLAVYLVLNLPLHTGIATPGERTADFDSIDRSHHQPSGPGGA